MAALRGNVGRNETGQFRRTNAGSKTIDIDRTGSGEEAGAGEEAGTGAGTGEETGTGTGEEAGTGRFFEEPKQFFDSGNNGTGRERRNKGGRPRGSKTRHRAGRTAEASKIPSSLEGIEGILLSLHMIVASFTGISELELADEEAKKLSHAIGRVAALYDIRASEQTIAWTNLVVCMGGIYGTRAFAYSLRKKTESESKGAAANPSQATRTNGAPGNVYPFNPFQQPAAGSSVSS